ncbi:Gliding motility-associated C-terminal domain-containing protein [Tenacibaculum sp. 190524A02b]|uniref:Gliding motility-associated C-terminal domain-containing protein n=1 Tax=Tenacibaculum vairaonense TaxID=3137860 RepID=A0ABM9PKY4_9FLAO
MKNFLSILIMVTLMPFSNNAQTAFHNFGNVKLHENANIGFHTDFINDGSLDNDNLGLAGFYSDSELRAISGDNRAVFHNLEIDALNDVELHTSIGVTNEMSFVNGRIYTPRNLIDVSLDYINHQLYVGEDNLRYVDGYASVLNQGEFIFPIGDDNRLRPMILPSENTNNSYKGAYYFNNPNTPPTHFTEQFTTTEKQVFLNNISNHEFWDLDGAKPTKITLTWDDKSQINTISESIQFLRVVGWSKIEGRWIDLGRSSVEGTYTTGKLTSNEFVPDDYTIITFGSEFPDGELADMNLIFTPNGDNVNQTLVFEGLEQYKNNNLEIFNRWGNIVYETDNYKNNWEGKSNGRVTVDGDNNLPVGTYFYVLKLGNDSLSKTQKGWVYIQR